VGSNVTTSTAAAPAEDLLRDQELEDQLAAQDAELAAADAQVAPPVEPSEETEDRTAGETADSQPTTGGLPENETAQRLSHRRALLDPVAVKLLQLLEQHREVDAPSQISLKGSAVYVSRWERELILEHHGDGEFPDRGWVTRVVDAISFQARALIDRERLGRSEDPDPRALHQLVMTAAVGIALKVELQKTVDRLIFSGEVGTAKQLSLTLQRISQAVTGCRDALERTESWPAAVELAPGLTCIPADATLPQAPARKRKRRPRQPSADEMAALAEMETGTRASAVSSSRRVGRTRAMLVVLLVLMATWSAIVLVPMLARQPLETLSITDFRTVPQVRQVVARPPSLYVTLSEREWDRLSSDSRLKVVDQIGEIAERSRYSGVVMRLPDGTTVGRWLRKKGPSVVE
jgi:hypothetical protein